MSNDYFCWTTSSKVLADEVCSCSSVAWSVWSLEEAAQLETGRVHSEHAKGLRIKLVAFARWEYPSCLWTLDVVQITDIMMKVEVWIWLQSLYTCLPFERCVSLNAGGPAIANLGTSWGIWLITRRRSYKMQKPKRCQSSLRTSVSTGVSTGGTEWVTLFGWIDAAAWSVIWLKDDL